MIASLRTLIENTSNQIAECKLTIAFAESATAGKRAYEFALTQHSGEILKGGLVCYYAYVKEGLLGVASQLIDEYTPESAGVTKEMSIKLKKLMRPKSLLPCLSYLP